VFETLKFENRFPYIFINCIFKNFPIKWIVKNLYCTKIRINQIDCKEALLGKIKNSRIISKTNQTLFLFILENNLQN